MILRPKKSLGQHFLTSQAAVRAIIRAADLSPRDTVLEIGPGSGVLTEALLSTGARVIAVEKDPTLVALLRAKFDNQPNLELVCGDILRYMLQATSYKLVANIPYYLTGALLRKITESEHPPSLCVLLLQKEVAERIVAKDGKESILSIAVKLFGTPSYVQTVKAGSFFPKPKVDSAIILIKRAKSDFALGVMAMVRRGFAHKRKLLASNLGVPRETLEKSGISPTARAEELSPLDWVKLYKAQDNKW